MLLCCLTRVHFDALGRSEHPEINCHCSEVFSLRHSFPRDHSLQWRSMLQLVANSLVLGGDLEVGHLLSRGDRVLPGVRV